VYKKPLPATDVTLLRFSGALPVITTVGVARMATGIDTDAAMVNPAPLA
jgi:hypothetical protein